MTLWTAQEIASATGGKLIGSDGWKAGSVAIDSRSLEREALFVAIKGERHDGHDHVGDAAGSGAAAALVHREPDACGAPQGFPLIKVPATMEGLRSLAAAARERSRARRIAVTGSVGKTTMRHTLARVLAAHRPCHASAGNLNNHIGAPLSLARMPRDAAFGVFELGMSHAGEIAALSGMVAPHHAIVTRIAKSHIGNFPSLEAIAAAKGEIFGGMEAGGTAFLNADDPHTPALADLARAGGAGQIVTIGEDGAATHRLHAIRRQAGGLEAEASLGGDRIAFRMEATGTHYARAGLAALAVAEAEGLDRNASIKALARVGDVDGRGRHHDARLADGRRFTLIDDSYNASPASMEAAIRDLAGNPNPGRRVAILADMLELGDESRDLHESLADPILADPPAVLILYGDGMEALRRALGDGAGIDIAAAGDAAGAADAALGLIQDGDVVLVKGSNGMRAGDVVRRLLGDGNGDTKGESDAA